MKSQAKTVAEYLAGLPEDRRVALTAIREVILANLPVGFEEWISYGMIGYVVPHRLYPKGYPCDPKLPLPFANLASQKNHMALHLMSVYGDPAVEQWFRKAWLATGKRLDMGKACVRFKRLEDVPLQVVGQIIARVSVADYIKRFESLRGAEGKRAKSGAGKRKAGRQSAASRK
jgi:hypothetical protein